MCCNNGIGFSNNNNWWWIIILILLFCNCGCGNNWSTWNNNGCGCNDNHCC